MNILHICNDFTNTSVHRSLYAALDRQGIGQQVFHPLRDTALIGRNHVDFSRPGSEIIYSETFGLKERLLFHRKISRLTADLRRKVDLDEVDLVHATTWYSDGAIALNLFREQGIPYVLAIRGTDINIFLRYLIHLRGLGREILAHAQKVIFISTALRENLLAHPSLSGMRDAILRKSEVINNGIDPFWLNAPAVREKADKPLRFLYVGNFSRNKNVVRLIRAFLNVQQKYPDIRLNLVGANGAQEGTARQLAKEHPGIINFLGPIHDKASLREAYADNDVFAMVSKSETFGLVYIEALSMGLPLVYTKGQGIDGFFGDRKVGEAVNAASVPDIGRGLETVIANYQQYQGIRPLLAGFDWNAIGERYRNIYRESLRAGSCHTAASPVQDTLRLATSSLISQ